MTVILRNITGAVNKPNGQPWPEAVVRLELVSSIVADADAEAVYPNRQQVIICDSLGVLPTGDNGLTVIGGYVYRLILPDGARGEFVAPAEIGVLTIDEVIGLIAGGAVDPTEGLTAVTLAQLTYIEDAIATIPDATDLIVDAPSDGTQYARKNEAWEAVATGAADVGDLTTTGLTADNMLRVAAGGGLEERTPAQVLGDIGAEAAGAAAVVQGNLDDHEGDTDNPHNVTAAQAGADPVGSAAAAQAASQPVDADLTAIAALANTDGNFIVGNGSAWVAESGATVRTSLGLGTMATETATNYHLKSEFSASLSNSSAPLRTDESGYLRLGFNGIGGLKFTNLYGLASGADTERIRIMANLQDNATGNDTFAKIYPTSLVADFPFDQFGNIVFQGRSDNNSRGSFAVLVGITPTVAFGVRASDKAVMIGNNSPGAQLHVTVGSASRIGSIIQLAATPTANALEIQASTGAVLAALTKTGAFSPPSLADASASNGTLYYSTTASRLVFKDSGGVVNNLY